MPKSCVVKKMKAGTSPLKSIKECYPDATDKAIKAMKSSFITPKIIKAVKKHISLKQIKKSKPKDLKIRKVVPEMEKNRRVTKAKSMCVN